MHYDAHYRGQSGQGATGERLNRLLMSAVVSTQMINVCEGSKHCPVIVRLEVRKEVVTAQWMPDKYPMWGHKNWINKFQIVQIQQNLFAVWFFFLSFMKQTRLLVTGALNFFNSGSGFTIPHHPQHHWSNNHWWLSKSWIDWLDWLMITCLPLHSILLETVQLDCSFLSLPPAATTCSQPLSKQAASSQTSLLSSSNASKNAERLCLSSVSSTRNYKAQHNQPAKTCSTDWTPKNSLTLAGRSMEPVRRLQRGALQRFLTTLDSTRTWVIILTHERH